MRRELSVFSNHLSDNFEDSLKIAVEYGYKYVDLCTYNKKIFELLTDDEMLEVKKLLDKYNLKVSTMVSTLFMNCKLYDDYEIEPMNPLWTFFGDYNEHLHMFRSMCKKAKYLGALNIRVFPFRWPKNKGVVGNDNDLNKIASIFSKAAEIAKEEKVPILLENCPYTHCAKGEMTYKVAKLVDSDYLKLVWDPGNSYRAYTEHVPEEYLGKSLEEELMTIYEQIGHIHFKDYKYDETAAKPFVHVATGTGDVDFIGLINKLNDLGYQGMISSEPEVPTLEATIESIDFVQNLNNN